MVSAIVLESLVPADVLKEIRSALADGTFVPGKETAFGGAADVKHNVQLSPDSPAAMKALELLVGALQTSAAFQNATWTDAIVRPLFCRYERGMKYGNHIDAAIMGEAPALMRCDIAVTVCLNGPTEYDGGELVIDAAGMSRSWRGQAGDALVYPADTLHHVSEVTRGVREVAVFWVQSLVRDAGKRRILFDLRAALEVLDQAREPPPHVEALRRSYYNLIRMWV